MPRARIPTSLCSWSQASRAASAQASTWRTWRAARLTTAAGSDTGAGSWLLPRQIGTPAALRLLYTGDDLGADEAVALGFAAAVHPSDELEKAARELAERIATASPFALARTKQLVLSGAGRTMTDHVVATREALAECFASEDHAEGVAAFLERRPARFTGR
ncbi:hypothetical protein GCM10023175_37690 [Pseudonocardia xishanensis]|uniref:Enoyl-CoA hydratase/isomerase family protein n=1 Tax=Pseudonocardia xishanensis TaxID=630995 RepID=A0ABP8RVK7_9PSEU